MNVALFSDSYFPTKSGIVTVVVQHRKALESMGHHVVIVTVSPSDDEYEEEIDPCVLRVHSIHSPVADQYIAIPHKNQIIDFLEKNKIEIIHSHTEFFIGQMSVIAGKHLGIPVIATTHTMWEDYYRYYLAMGRFISKRMIRKGVRGLYKNFYALINVSQKAHDYFKRSFMLPRIPSTIIPNALDMEKFNTKKFTDDERRDLKIKLGISEKDTVVIYVGRIVKEKRISELLEIFKKVVSSRENVKAVFVGSGYAESELREDVAHSGLGDKIIFTGYVNWQNLSLYYSIADIFVTVSLSEMHSMTILEAMSMGLPVVCRQEESFGDTVFHGQNGYAAETDEEVGSYILEFADNPEKCKKMGECAYEVSQRFTLDVYGKRTVAFYEKVLETFPQKISSIALRKAVDSVVTITNPQQ